MKKRDWFAILALSSMMMVGACSAEPDAPAVSDPEAPAGISVADGRLTLPAVAGNPGAVYFTIRNSSDSDKMIRAANVAGAGMAMMHVTATWNNQPDMQELVQLEVPAGGEVEFSPGGYHVMAMDLAETLAVGGETEVTLTFVGGDKISFPAEIRPAGDDGSSDSE